MCTSILRICVACALLVVAFAEIPPYMKICNRNDPEINSCVLNSIDQLRGKLKTGIPELDVPAIEPLILKQVQLVRGPQAARLDLNLTNIQIFGPSLFKLRDLKIDPENVLITFKVGFQKLDFRGKYKINAQILLLKLVGEGGLTGSFYGYECDCLLKSHKVVRNNNTYIVFEKMKFDIKINKALINLDNLFGGDPILGPASNEVLNANSNYLIDELKPVLEDTLSDLFTNIANKITSRFTYNELFPN
ncbi:circadian clock-controlled protein daywake [Solenopsis invicta]|uniref:circadian clock-controlled protein daywake n=1 Tax=Solenopsis invicta TaxID=13686 RepID=UPI0005961D38|nr:circadian clock-controlled protein daywake [Solenopsis invicta]